MDFGKYVKCPWKIILALNSHGLGRIIPDSVFLKAIFRERMGYKLNLKNPRTFNEKLQWLKLYDRKPIYTTMVDKDSVKKYVASVIGEKYIIPTLGIWDKFEDIDFAGLPNQFVLKCTHDSGGLIIVQDKDKFDRVAASEQLNKCLKMDYYLLAREWPYKNVKPRIIAEKYLTNEAAYKGKNFAEIGFDKDIQATELNYETFIRKESVLTKCFKDQLDDIYQSRSNLPNKADKKEVLCKMSSFVRGLSEGSAIQQIDFYDIEGRLFLGDLTVGTDTESLRFGVMRKGRELGIKVRFLARGGWWMIQSDEFVFFAHKNIADQIEDYKFFCFNGKVKCFKVDFDRNANHGANYYDVNYEILPFGEKICPPDFKRNIELPRNMNEMIILAEKLSVGHPFLRVDMYNINGDIYFGELTFFPAAGLGAFIPEEWDYLLGNEIGLR